MSEQIPQNYDLLVKHSFSVIREHLNEQEPLANELKRVETQWRRWGSLDSVNLTSSNQNISYEIGFPYTIYPDHYASDDNTVCRVSLGRSIKSPSGQTDINGRSLERLEIVFDTQPNGQILTELLQTTYSESEGLRTHYWSIQEIGSVISTVMDLQNPMVTDNLLQILHMENAGIIKRRKLRKLDTTEDRHQSLICLANELIAVMPKPLQGALIDYKEQIPNLEASTVLGLATNDLDFRQGSAGPGLATHRITGITAGVADLYGYLSLLELARYAPRQTPQDLKLSFRIGIDEKQIQVIRIMPTMINQETPIGDSLDTRPGYYVQDLDKVIVQITSADQQISNSRLLRNMLDSGAVIHAGIQKR